MADLFGRLRRNRDAGALDPWLSLGLDEEAAWTALVPGPPVAALASRLSTAPRDFLADEVDLVALGGDVLPERPDAAEVLRQATANPESRRGAALALWLWASSDVVEPFTPPLSDAHAPRAIAALAFRLARVVPPGRWLVEAERREEAARLFLLWAGHRPADESPETARARFDGVDSVAQDAAMRAALQDHQHRLRVQSELRAQRAAEAAARYTHE